MPLFEYQCPSCQASFELLVRAESVPHCPQCGSAELTRLLSLPARPVTASAATTSTPCGDPGLSGGCCGGGACGLN